jgi:hypothetical protein
MTSRREFVFTALASVGEMAVLPSCSSETGVDSYEKVGDHTWRHSKVSAGDKASLLHELGSLLFGFFITPNSENDKYAKHVRSSAGIAIFVSDNPGPAHWLEAGRCYERFAIQSAAMGVRNAMLNQPVEVATLQPQFATFLGVGKRRPDLVVRFGRGPKLPCSLRRPVQAVLV